MRADMTLDRAEQAVEQKLLRYYAAGDPTPTFVERVGRQLNAQAAAQTQRHPAPRFWTRWLAAPVGLRWATGAAALLLVAALAIGAVGPQRVWAQAQRLLGYVPGGGDGLASLTFAYAFLPLAFKMLAGLLLWRWRHSLEIHQP